MNGPKDNITLLSKKEAQSLRESQIQRYQHMQSLAQGLMVGGITIIAIIATLVTVIDGQFPTNEISESVASETASAITVISVSKLTINVTMVLGSVLAICYAFLGAYLFANGLWILFDIVTFQGLGAKSHDNVLYLPSKPFENTRINSQLDRINIFEQVQWNREIIRKQHKKFLNGALRMPTGLLIFGLGIYIYYSAAFGEVKNTLTMSLYPIISIIIIPIFTSNKVKTESDQKYSHSSLNEELWKDNEEESRWQQTKILRGEKILYITLVILSALIALIWLVAIFY